MRHLKRRSLECVHTHLMVESLESTIIYWQLRAVLITVLQQPSLSLYISSSLLGSIILFTGRFQRSSLYLYATPVHKFGSKPCTRFFANSVVRVEIMWLTTTLALSTSRGTIVGPWKQFGPFLVISVSHNNEVEAPVTDHLRDSLLDVDKNIRWCKLCPV